MNTLLPVPLIETRKLNQLVEQKRSFNFRSCELNIYETRKVVTDFPLKFRGFTVTSMLRGEKIAHIPKEGSLAYNPGNSIITPSYQRIGIDFPKASLTTPTQCIALSIEDSYVRTQLDYFNEVMGEKYFVEDLNVLQDPTLVNNNEELVSILERISKLVNQPDPYRNLQMQLLASELILCITKIKNLKTLSEDAEKNTNQNAFAGVIQYIKSHLSEEIEIDDLIKVAAMSKSAFYRGFLEELGISPYQLIIEERLKVAKKMLEEEGVSIKETAYALGFSSANYFTRIFKKNEGITPKEYRNSRY
ncbi:MAG: helix-turn-helix domain-containing protein [Ekhidna sp.]|nr:helix-turn-helix domain-containing protein [Ekhidna sp.]